MWGDGGDRHYPSRVCKLATQRRNVARPDCPDSATSDLHSAKEGDDMVFRA